MTARRAAAAVESGITVLKTVVGTTATKTEVKHADAVTTATKTEIKHADAGSWSVGTTGTISTIGHRDGAVNGYV